MALHFLAFKSFHEKALIYFSYVFRKGGLSETFSQQYKPKACSAVIVIE